ncbi:DUF6216 family protein [Paraburkholderia sp. BR14263]|uniref:DUF6216 family protein n=1 Tax=unclassified Paraburkholderia TaxID=2615204 RepID=UPI0034CF8406
MYCRPRCHACELHLFSNKTTYSKTSLLTLPAPNTRIWSDDAGVESTWGKHYRIDAQSCAKHTLPDTAITGLTRSETTAICIGIPSGELMATVSEGLN